ncbi:MAG: hypothetical protein P1U78_13930 [Alcanivoracaceae bacterium]|nr:hypothetical protein [Alcanivoracaceae bacterium]
MLICLVLCGVDMPGAVFCFNVTTFDPIPVRFAEPISEVSVGRSRDEMVCGLTMRTQMVVCAELGGTDVGHLLQVAPSYTALSLQSNNEHMCIHAKSAGDKFVCFTSTPSDWAIPIDQATTASLKLTHQYSCSITTSGVGQCQLQLMTPITLKYDNVTDIAAGWSGVLSHTAICTINISGNVMCEWTGSGVIIHAPTALKFITLDIYTAYACGITDAAELYCWTLTLPTNWTMYAPPNATLPDFKPVMPQYRFHSLKVSESNTQHYVVCGLTLTGLAKCYEHSVGIISNDAISTVGGLMAYTQVSDIMLNKLEIMEPLLVCADGSVHVPLIKVSPSVPKLIPSLPSDQQYIALVCICICCLSIGDV